MHRAGAFVEERLTVSDGRSTALPDALTPIRICRPFRVVSDVSCGFRFVDPLTASGDNFLYVLDRGCGRSRGCVREREARIVRSRPPASSPLCVPIPPAPPRDCCL
jgi:hypothetical protein